MTCTRPTAETVVVDRCAGGGQLVNRMFSAFGARRTFAARRSSSRIPPHGPRPAPPSGYRARANHARANIGHRGDGFISSLLPTHARSRAGARLGARRPPSWHCRRARRSFGGIRTVSRGAVGGTRADPQGACTSALVIGSGAEAPLLEGGIRVAQMPCGPPTWRGIFRGFFERRGRRDGGV